MTAPSRDFGLTGDAGILGNSPSAANERISLVILRNTTVMSCHSL